LNAAAGNLVSRVMLWQLAVCVITFVAFVSVAPRLLLLDADEGQGALFTALYVGVITELVAIASVYRRLERVRYVLRALALGSRAFEPDDLVELATVPGFVTQITVGAAAGASLSTLLPFLRPAGIDFQTAFGLLLLVWLLVAAAAMPLYVLVRSTVSAALELAPTDLAGEAVESLTALGTPRRRVRTHMLLAVVSPVLVIAVGAALTAQSHVRHAVTNARVDLAVALARCATEDVPGPLAEAGQEEAFRIAASHDFFMRIDRGSAPFGARRNEDGLLEVTVPVEHAHASVRFAGSDQGSSSGSLSGSIAVVVLVSLLLAVTIGSRLGSTLSRDLGVATRRVRALGRDRALRVWGEEVDPARFAIVVDLGRVVDLLASRFRVFSGAQERAIEAREAALRLRGLLFASVSHDLKSPLNAILGFASLAMVEELLPSQEESVRIIERRARELLTLIETILDAARVDAQKLTILPAPTSIEAVFRQGIRRGDELGPMDAAEVVWDLDDDLPEVVWDDARMAQAIAAVIGHAKRLAPRGGVVVRARREGPASICLEIEDPSGTFSVAEIARLLDAQYAATAPRRMGGLALGLSLARALVKLHDGTLEAKARPGTARGVLFRFVLPRVVEGPPPSSRGRFVSS
jgi:signal transduction histidine kinase